MSDDPIRGAQSGHPVSAAAGAPGQADGHPVRVTPPLLLPLRRIHPGRRIRPPGSLHPGTAGNASRIFAHNLQTPRSAR